MIKYVDHIGIAVADLDKSNDLFERLLGHQPYKKEYVASENVYTSFFLKEGSKIELLWSEDIDNVISKYVAKKGEGLHHIAFEVDNIVEEMDRLRQEGFTLLNEQPKRGADNKLVCFIHPKSANGVLIELCQSLPSSIAIEPDQIV